MLLGVLIIVYNKVQTFLLRILLFICHSSVCFPIFSQRLESALPTLAFVRLGKHRLEGSPLTGTLTCLNHSVVILLRVME